MKLLSFIITIFISYMIFDIVTDPKSSIHKRLPKFKIRWFQFLPNIRIHVKGRVIFLHHWMNLSIILVITIIISGGLFDSLFPKGLLVGGILQGFTFPAWKKII